MGFLPSGARSAFGSIDQRTAYAAFKSSGSFDPDALYAQKESMIAPYRNLKRLAVAGGIAGLLVAFVLAMKVPGLVIVVGSWLLWRFQARQVRNIEAGYAQYVGG